MKYSIVVCVWLVLMSNVLWAKSYVIRYEIYDDSKVSSVFEVKKSLFAWYDDLANRVDDVYVNTLLANEIDGFRVDNVEISFENDKVILVIGDGLGVYISGELVEESCVVKPRGTSFLQELFDK